MNWAKHVRFVLVAGCVCVWGFAGSTAAGATGRCPNEVLRIGRSVDLPDCRAYELVTPEELGRTADMLFDQGLDRALPAADGERLALEAPEAFLEPGAEAFGTLAVFSRTLTGWTMEPVATSRAISGQGLQIRLLSPDLSHVMFSSHDPLNTFQASYEVGPVGGPYSAIVENATIFPEPKTHFLGANAGSEGVPTFSYVVFESEDSILPPGPEREQAERTEGESANLYEWAGGGRCEVPGSSCRLVNVNNEGKLLDRCGATLGAGSKEGSTLNAVSPDGSKIFFTSPFRERNACKENPQLYMRVGGRETVEVSAPEGVIVPPSERGVVGYDGASADGSKVFFTSGTPLVPGTGAGYHLYEYNTQAAIGNRLTLIANEVTKSEAFINPHVVVSEDGSTVYYVGTGAIEENGRPVSVSGIWRYEAATGRRSFVAVPSGTLREDEPYYTTRDGRFLVFPSGHKGGPPLEFFGPHGLVPEPRGAGHEELYRYEAVDGSVMCVSCGVGNAPTKGKLREQDSFHGLLTTPGGSRAPISISEDGRRVFFQTSAQLVPQDTNEETVSEQESPELGVATDVYEWEQVGAEEAPGVFCRVASGCTHLISAGEAVGPERFLGASTSGRDVFFTSSAQLVPWAAPEFTNIYDARMEGGFPAPVPAPVCVSCQGVGSPPPQFNTPASETFAGAGSPPASPGAQVSVPNVKSKHKPKCRGGHKRRHGGRCVKVARHGRGGRP
jgi:hypothetical protein